MSSLQSGHHSNHYVYLALLCLFFQFLVSNGQETEIYSFQFDLYPSNQNASVDWSYSQQGNGITRVQSTKCTTGICWEFCCKASATLHLSTAGYDNFRTEIDVNMQNLTGGDCSISHSDGQATYKSSFSQPKIPFVRNTPIIPVEIGLSVTSKSNEALCFFDNMKVFATPIIQSTAIPSTPSTAPTTSRPSSAPTLFPSSVPTFNPNAAALTDNPTKYPTKTPTKAPTKAPTAVPAIDLTMTPSFPPILYPTKDPTKAPTTVPTIDPTMIPSFPPTLYPTKARTSNPTPADAVTKNYEIKIDINNCQVTDNTDCDVDPNDLNEVIESTLSIDANVEIISWAIVDKELIIHLSVTTAPHNVLTPDVINNHIESKVKQNDDFGEVETEEKDDLKDIATDNMQNTKYLFNIMTVVVSVCAVCGLCVLGYCLYQHKALKAQEKMIRVTNMSSDGGLSSNDDTTKDDIGTNDNDMNTKGNNIDTKDNEDAKGSTESDEEDERDIEDMYRHHNTRGQTATGGESHHDTRGQTATGGKSK